MKEILHKSTALLLALLVLLSTMSFSVDIHYCGDHLVDLSIFDSVENCMMKSKKSKSSSTCENMEKKMKMSCCSDVEISIEGQDDLEISLDQFTVDQQQFIISFTYSYINLFKKIDQNVIPFRDYAPPPLIRDVQIQDQTFLI